MFCEKCGKDNPAGTESCKYCGTSMPKKSGSGGFSDILNFEGGAPAAKSDVKNVGNEMELKRIQDRLSSMNGRVQKQGLFSLGAVAVCLVIAIVSLCVSCSALHKVGDIDGSNGSAASGENKTQWQQDIKKLEDTIKKEKDKSKSITEESGVSKEKLEKADSYLKAIDAYYEVLKETKEADEKVTAPEVEVNGEKRGSKEMTAQEMKTEIEGWLVEVAQCLEVKKLPNGDELKDKKKDKDNEEKQRIEA